MLWLVSDLVLLDERLRPSTTPHTLRRALEDALGLDDGDLTLVSRGAAQAGEPGAADENPTTTPTVLATRRTDSWQARWGLPRPTLCGFAAGSVATFELAEGVAVHPDLVGELENAGLGERRGEGLGQVLVATGLSPNAPTHGGPLDILTSFTAGRPERTDPSSATDGTDPEPLTADEAQTLTALRREAWRRRIAERAAQIAAVPRTRAQVLGTEAKDLTATQLAALRGVLPSLESDLATAARLIDRLANRARRRAWPTSVAVATKSLIVDRDRVWDVLGSEQIEGRSGAEPEPGASAASARQALRAELWPEAVQAVILAALTAHRRDEEAKAMTGDQR
jgi:CRISPR-associated protein Csx10